MSFTHSCRRASWLAFPLLVASGCTNYRADPLDPAAELAAFARRDLTTAGLPAPQPGPGQGLREEHLVAIALRQHPHLAIVRARRGLADAVLIDAGLWPNPELALAVRGGSPGVTADLDLLAALLRPGERRARQAAAEAGQREALADVAHEEWRVVAEVRLARVELIAAAAHRRAAQDAAELTRTAADAMERRYLLGDATERDLATARAESAATRRSLRDASALLASRERQLNRLLGIAAGLAVPIAGRDDALAPLDANAAVPPDAAKEAMHGRWDLAAARAVYDRSDQELQLAIARQYPALRIGPSATRDSDGTTVGGALALELPIFDRNQGGIRAAEAMRDEARARFQALMQQALAEVADATAELQRAAGEVAALDIELMPAARRALDLADGALQVREMGLLEYLTVRRGWLDAQRARLDAVADSHRAAIALDAALGRGSASLARPDPVPARPAGEAP